LVFISGGLALGLTGVFIAFLITITFGFIGIWNPTTGIIMMLLGIMISYGIGLIFLSETFIGILVIAGVLVFKLRPRVA